VSLPRFIPTEWQTLVTEAASPDVFLVQQTGQFDFTALYQDDVLAYRVRFATLD
jgi:hypothetical protein